MNNPEAIQDRSSWFSQLIPVLDGVEGDIAEFGVFNGGNTKHLLKFGRRVWAFDTYGGLPVEDYTESVDSGNPPGKFSPEHQVLEFFKEESNFYPMVGRFIDTLPLVENNQKFIALFIDCDYYESHWQIFHWLPDHLVENGIIMFDDYDGLEGAKKAIDEFCQKHGQTLRENHFIVWEKEHGSN
jgi:hypothetical protein